MATFEHLRADTYYIAPVGGPEFEVGPGAVFDVDDADLAKSLRAQPDAYREVSEGTTRSSADDVLKDVGDDRDKARAALAVEEQSDRPRKTLVNRLTEIAAASAEEE